jgi:hypothetical protein
MRISSQKTKHNWYALFLFFFLIVGLTFFLTGLFADRLGMDPNNGWGVRRLAVLEAGYLIAAGSFFLLLYQYGLCESKVFNWVIFFVVLQCMFIYFWYETAGTMKIVDKSGYYDMQAQAFLHGQLNLLQNPSPELLALPDPYDPTQNESFRLSDVILYKGKYYLYWGPFPALILAGIKLMFNQTFSDSFLVLLFMSGYIAFVALIMVELRRKISPNSPIWILALGVVFGGGMNPALWLLARAAIYEAAIAGGQFCLLVGIFFVLKAFTDGDIKIDKLIFSGIFLACAVLSRISLVLAVGWIALFVVFNLLKRSGFFNVGILNNDRFVTIHFLPSLMLTGRLKANANKVNIVSNFLKPALAFGVPLFLGATSLFIYNAVRFGSPFEIGAKFALAGIKQIKYIENGSFHSLQYILPNLNTYFFFPVQKLQTFPFLEAPWNSGWHPGRVDAALNSPNRYMLVEPIAGMFVTSPILWLICLALLFNIINAHRFTPSSNQEYPEKDIPDTSWSFHLFAGLALFTFLPVSLEFTATMRYIFDFSSSWYFLSYLSFMFGYNRLGKIGKNLFVVCYLFFGMATFVNGALLGIISYENHFSSINPRLFEALLSLFSF